MRQRTLSGRINSLSMEKKVMVIGSFATLVSCFLPWYGINSRVINEWWNAFNSIGSVAGYVIALFSLLSLGLLAFPLLKPDYNLWEKLPFRESDWLTFLSGQSFFVAMLFIPVYAQYSLLNATSSSARFGIYLAVISSLGSFIAALSDGRKPDRTGASSEFMTVQRQHRGIENWAEETDPEAVPVDRTSEEDFQEQESIFDTSEKLVSSTPENKRSTPSDDQIL